ncbi:MAG: hypothetical protein ACRDH9_01355 [Actinomycetota bacterium]
MKEVDELFRLPPDRFTDARDELARRLTQAGDKSSAADVKKLRKPTLTAWTLNQLSRRSRKDLAALIQAGDELRAAQRKAASGLKESGFQAAVEQRRRAIQKLTAKATAILSEAGKAGQSAEAEIGRTLEAASVDREAGEQLLQGRLSKPIATVPGFDSVTGFEVIAGGVQEAMAERAARKATETAARNAERHARKAETDAQRARLRADTLVAEARVLTERARSAEREAEKLETAAAEAEKRHLEAQRKLDR